MYRLLTLGSLEVEGRRYGQQKPLVLLSYLALEGVQERRHVAALFWPGASDPLNRLSVTLSRLSRDLPGSFEATPTTVRALAASDAAEMRQALRDGDLATARRLFRGPFLLGARVRGAGAELQDWVDSTRDGLAHALQRALLEAAAAPSAADTDEAAALVREALSVADSSLLEPEDLAFVHRALARVGDPSAPRLARDLAALGLDGDGEGGRDAVGLGRRPTAHLGPHHAEGPDDAAPDQRLLGRSAERAKLRELLVARRRRLVTVAGPGGVGKSLLARVVAGDLGGGDAFPGGVLFLDCQRAATAAEALRQAYEALDVDAPVAGPDAPVAGPDPRNLAERLAVRGPTLLVLDDFDHLVAGADWLKELLDAARGVSCLVTASQPLGYREEDVLPLGGLPLGPDGTGPATDLFLASARRADAAFELTPADAEHLVELHRLTGGLPLALELAAAWVTVMPVSGIAEALSADVAFLASPLRDAPARHRSLIAVFERAWSLLDEPSRRQLRRVAAFRGPFDRAAAGALGVGLEDLAALCRRSLLARLPSGRFVCQPTLRTWLDARSGDDPSATAEARDRHAHHFLSRARAAAQAFDTRDGGRWLAELDDERADLLAAIAWCWERGDLTGVVEFLQHTAQYWVRRGHLDLVLPWYERLSSLDVEGGEAGRLAACLNAYAFSLMVAGDPDSSARVLARALTLARRSGEARPLVRSLNLLGVLAVYQLELGVAEDRYLEAVAVARENGLADDVGRALNNIGDVKLFSGRPDLAEPFYLEALEMERALGNLQMTSNVLGSLALVAVHLGDLAVAERRLRESTRLLTELGIVFSLATALEQYAVLFTAAGRPELAGRVWGAAEALRDRLGTPLEPFAALEKVRWTRQAAERAGPAAFEAALHEGRSMPAEAARDLALREAAALAVPLTGEGPARAGVTAA